MTRLTDHHRLNIKRAIIAEIPVIDYLTPCVKIVQDYLCTLMPEGIRAAYENELSRARYLSHDSLNFQQGNNTIDQRRPGFSYNDRSHRPIWGWRTIMSDFEVEHLTSDPLRIKFIFPEDLENADPVKANPYRRANETFETMTKPEQVLSLHRASMWDALFQSGLIHQWVADNRLYAQTIQRLTNNLEAASTIKRLYEVLEPDLHRFIPKEPEKIRATGLPSVVAPVADDLRKLGVNLAETPTAHSPAPHVDFPAGLGKSETVTTATTNQEEGQ